MNQDAGMLVYKRARFGTRLPMNRIYTRSHYWLRETQAGIWRVGLTKFAVRMLGDIVEYQFEVEPGKEIGRGNKIGWIEGFKAVSDLYAVAEGEFRGSNPGLREDITLLESDPYEQGWLYEVKGLAEPDHTDAAGYASVLDAIIEKMLAGRHDAGGQGDEGWDG